MTHPPSGNHPKPAALVLGLAALLAVLATVFAWPSSELAPRDLPVAVAGVGAASDRIESALTTTAGSGAFAVDRVGSRDEAVAAIEGREVYAAFVAEEAGVELLVASAASPAVAQLMTQVAQTVGDAAGQPSLVVTDVVPLPAEDPRGAGFGSAALPLIIGGIAVGAVVALRAPHRTMRLGLAVGAALLGGLAMTAVLHTWLGVLAGSFWVSAGVIGLGLAAAAATVLALHAQLGPPGIGLAGVITMLLGNPLSAVSSAPELLPSGWGELGQWLVPGATGTALRSVAFFDAAGSATALLVLAGWVLVGVALVWWAPVRRTAPDSVDREPATVRAAG